MYQYWGFGLNILSEIAFPELLEKSFEAADVTITCGKVPGIIAEEAYDNDNYSFTITASEFLFDIKDLAKYYTAKGNTIIIEPNGPVNDMREVRIFVLATVFAALLLQRKTLPLHASAVVHHNKLLLVMGDSGAGKSTALAGLLKKGYEFFSDDVVVTDQFFKASSSYPIIKLWEDAQQKLNDAIFDDRSFIVRPGFNKYGISRHKNFNTGSYAINDAFILKIGAGEISSRRLVAAEAFVELSKQVYRPRLLHNNELRKFAFIIISHLAKSCNIYHVKRPENCNPERLIAHIENILVTNE